MYKSLCEYIKHYVLNDDIVKLLFRDGVKVIYSSNNIVILTDMNEKNKIVVFSYFRKNRDNTREIDYTFEIVDAKMTLKDVIDYIKTVRGDYEIARVTKTNYRKQLIKRIRNNKNAKYVLRV